MAVIGLLTKSTSQWLNTSEPMRNPVRRRRLTRPATDPRSDVQTRAIAKPCDHGLVDPCAGSTGASCPAREGMLSLPANMNTMKRRSMAYELVTKIHSGVFGATRWPRARLQDAPFPPYRPSLSAFAATGVAAAESYEPSSGARTMAQPMAAASSPPQRLARSSSPLRRGPNLPLTTKPAGSARRT